ncbi:MAG: gamma-glutamylcyclotransferase family protein, partial [Myxococcota bacterium]
GFRCCALRGAVYPGLVPETRAVARGVLWGGLDERTLARIDRFEGELYERRSVAVEREVEAACEAFVYVLGPAGRGVAEAAPWDEAEFRARHLAAYLRGCRAFARQNP